MLHRTEGIVLRTIPFGDADLIVSFLTPDLGLLKTFAKSPLKTKSRFGSSLEPLTHSRIAFWGKEDTTLPRLTQSDIIHSFQSMRDTLNCFIKVSEIIELTLQFIPEREANTKVYALFLHTLHNIENNLPSPHFNSPSTSHDLSKGARLPSVGQGYRGVKGGEGGLSIEEKIKILLNRGIQFIEHKGEKVNLPWLMRKLGEKEITSVLVEAGSSMNAYALEEGIVDKVMVFIAPKIIGGKESFPAVGGRSFRKLEEAYRLKDVKVRRVGGDILIEGYIEK